METANDCITKHGKALPGTADRNKHYKLQVIEKLTNIVMNKCKILYLLNISNLFCFLKSTNRSIEPNAG